MGLFKVLDETTSSSTNDIAAACKADPVLVGRRTQWVFARHCSGANVAKGDCYAALLHMGPFKRKDDINTGPPKLRTLSRRGILKQSWSSGDAHSEE